MRKTGKTPLFRAKKIEKILNVGEIYIKLEGANPGHHLQDRLAEMITIEASHLNCQSLLIMGNQTFTEKVKYFAIQNGIEPLIPVFKNEKWKIPHIGKEGFIDLRNEKAKDPFDYLTQRYEDSNIHLTYANKNTHFISEIATEEVTKEIIYRLEEGIESIFVQPDIGFEIDTAKRVIYKKWIEKKLPQLPEVFTALKKVPQISAWDEQMVLVDESLQKEALKYLRQVEGLKVSSQAALPFVAFLQKVKKKELHQGKHVIILNDAKTEVQIDNLNDFDEVSKKELIQYTRDWLVQYADSQMETQEAIENAYRDGFILLASRDGEYEGLCIIVHTGFDVFIPTYHLAYIGTHEKTKGRGVGTELIYKAIELTDGKLSLHVDLDNKGAKKLYEKLGFEHTYNRMLYKG